MVDETYHGYDTDTLVEQFAEVRRTGATNMIVKPHVRGVAKELGFDELPEFIGEATNEEYMEVLEEMGERR